MLLLNILLVALAALLLVPVGILCAECLAAMLPFRKIRGAGRAEDASAPSSSHIISRPPIAVLIPAHNEESVLSHTLSSLMPQMRPDDRVIVIADNCDDATVSIARASGAIAI
ncbi:MAG: glycosyl transferase family 2, partial [bacterium]|nr:glycosyl transferase family 2 [bacterium]